MPIKILIDKAHDAAAKRDFKEAAKLYGMIMRDSALNERVDLKVRYAFCLEKIGKYHESIKYYLEVIDSHKGTKNTTAMDALESKVTLLRSFISQREASEKKKMKKNKSFTEQMQAAATSDFAGYLDLGTGDLSGESKARKAHDQSHLNFSNYLSLETQDFTPPPDDDDEATQDLSKIDD